MVFINRPLIVRNNSLISELRDSLTRKSVVREEFEKQPRKDEMMMKNIYSDGKTMRCHVDKFDWVNLSLKYKLWVPLLLVAERVTDGRLRKDVPRESYNRNLEIFNDSFERSIKDWGWLFLRNCDNNPNNDKSKKWWDDEFAVNSVNARLLRSAKDSALTLCLYDTAYREFVNIWMHNVAQMMLDEYKGRSVNHLFYTDCNVYDVRYFYHWRINNKESFLRYAGGP